MNVDQRIITRLDGLIAFGQKLMATRTELTYGGGYVVDIQIANQWFTSCLNLIQRIFGDQSTHYQRFKELFSSDLSDFNQVNQAFGVLLAAKDDFEKEGLFSLKKIVEADLFNEFLEQSEHLLNAGYFQPAAVIAGCVLEDGLRKLCVANGVPLPNDPKLDWMNSELAKKGIYAKLMQKRITTLADIRNSAAHGKWTEFEKSDVQSMVRDIRDFMTKHYS